MSGYADYVLRLAFAIWTGRRVAMDSATAAEIEAALALLERAGLTPPPAETESEHYEEPEDCGPVDGVPGNGWHLPTALDMYPAY